MAMKVKITKEVYDAHSSMIDNILDRANIQSNVDDRGIVFTTHGSKYVDYDICLTLNDLEIEYNHIVYIPGISGISEVSSTNENNKESKMSSPLKLTIRKFTLTTVYGAEITVVVNDTKDNGISNPVMFSNKYASKNQALLSLVHYLLNLPLQFVAGFERSCYVASIESIINSPDEMMRRMCGLISHVAMTRTSELKN